jgi:hypothetical protein
MLSGTRSSQATAATIAALISSSSTAVYRSVVAIEACLIIFWTALMLALALIAIDAAEWRSSCGHSPTVEANHGTLGRYEARFKDVIQLYRKIQELMAERGLDAELAAEDIRGTKEDLFCCRSVTRSSGAEISPPAAIMAARISPSSTAVCRFVVESGSVTAERDPVDEGTRPSAPRPAPCLAALIRARAAWTRSR